jgi:hypothetical protein
MHILKSSVSIERLAKALYLRSSRLMFPLLGDNKWDNATGDIKDYFLKDAAVIYSEMIVGTEHYSLIG